MVNSESKFQIIQFSFGSHLSKKFTGLCWFSTNYTKIEFKFFGKKTQRFTVHKRHWNFRWNSIKNRTILKSILNAFGLPQITDKHNVSKFILFTVWQQRWQTQFFLHDFDFFKHFHQQSLTTIELFCELFNRKSKFFLIFFRH